MEKVDAVVIGAGVVGLACGRALAMRGVDAVVVEQHESFGTETSARNSEVVHAGIYYPQGSLKAQLCVEGRRMLYRFCADHGVAHRKCGKLIVATDRSQHEVLQNIRVKAAANGVEGVHQLSASEARKLEPQLECTVALLSEETGIVDSHGLMLALLGDAESAGTLLAVRTKVMRGQCSPGRIKLEVTLGDGARTQIEARYVVNCAGLGAWQVADGLVGYPREALPVKRFAKGNYFSLSGRSPFSRLVYPIPEPGGLGVHLTLDLAGQARFGPDVEWVPHPEYDVHAERALGFYAQIRKYWPSLRDGQLTPAYSGVRPKIHGPEVDTADFLVQGPDDHGVGGLINLFGIESPGLTSSLALAEFVCRKLGFA